MPTTRTLDEVLYDLAMSTPYPTDAVVDDFVRRYPAYAEDIVDLAADLVHSFFLRNYPME